MKLRSMKIQQTEHSSTVAAVELQIDDGKDTKAPTKKRKTAHAKTAQGDVPFKAASAPSVAAASNIDDFIEKIGANENQRNDLAALHQLVTRLAPNLEVNTTDFKDTIAYGKYHYKYKSGREGDSFKIGISCSKEISLRCCAMLNGKYILESYSDRELGKKCWVGKSCVRFKALSDLSIPVVEKVILAAAEADIVTNV